MIALSFALPEESKGLVTRLEGAKRTGAAALPWITGKLYRQEIEIVHTGMGHASAAGQLERFLAGRQPRLLIAAGFGGSLEPGLEVGEVAVAENESDPALLAKLKAEIPPFRTGRLVTVDAVVETGAAKAELARQTGASFVDMETAEISRQCRARGIPLLAVRAISDGPREDLLMPAGVWFDAKAQRPRPVALVGHLLLHPGKIAPFARFVGGVNVAREELTKFLVSALAALE